MAYTRAHLDLANRHVTEGTERIANLRRSIATAQRRGYSTHLAEAALATMLVTMELMIDHQREIAEAVDPGQRLSQLSS